MNKITKFIFVSLGVSLVSASAQADWRVMEVRGQAWLAEEQKLLAKGQTIQSGQVVGTGQGSRLELREGTKVVLLGGNSKLLLKSVEKNQPSSVELLEGMLRAKIKKAAFEVNTAAAVTGVRGTEFFVSSEHGRDFICTIDGLVEVEDKDTGQKLAIPAKTGVELAPGRTPVIAPTSDELVAKWKNDTATNFFDPVVMESYDVSEVRLHRWADNLYWGIRASLNVTAAENLAYSALTMPPSLRLLQSRISPALKWGKKYSLTWIPRALIHLSNADMILDANPLLIQKNVQHFDLGELYGQTEWLDLRIKAGYQTFNWDDGFYFSNNYWQLEPYLFPAVRINYQTGKNFFELAGIVPGNVGRLNAQTPVEMLVFKYDYSNWLTLFAGHRSYTQTDSSEPALSRGHRFFEVGTNVKRRSEFFSFRMGGMVQKGDLFRSLQSERSFNSHMFDAQVDFYPVASQSLRLSAQWIEASENFVPGFENPYNLGFSQIIPRINLNQYRAKVSFSPRNDRWVLSLEGIQNYSVGTSDLTLWQGSHVHMLDEVDLSWNQSWPPSWQTIVSAIWFNPTAAMSETSPNWSKKAGVGLMAYTQYSF